MSRGRSCTNSSSHSAAPSSFAVEPYAGGNGSEVRTLTGKPDRLALYIPGSQIFAVLVLDDAGRMTSSRLISPGHDIRRRFSYPDASPPYQRDQ